MESEAPLQLEVHQAHCRAVQHSSGDTSCRSPTRGSGSIVPQKREQEIVVTVEVGRKCRKTWKMGRTRGKRQALNESGT